MTFKTIRRWTWISCYVAAGWWLIAFILRWFDNQTLDWSNLTVAGLFVLFPLFMDWVGYPEDE